VPPGKTAGFSTSMRYVAVSMIETEKMPLKKKFKAGGFTKKAFNASHLNFSSQKTRKVGPLLAPSSGKAILAQ